MTEIFYATNVRIPTEKAHGIQIMKMCEAFGNSGVEVELIIPNNKSTINQDPFDYYGVKKNFKITQIWCLKWSSFGKIGFWVESITFALSASIYFMFKQRIIYTRSENVALLAKILGKKVVWEAHMGHFNLVTKLIIYFKIRLVVITSGLKNFYISHGLPKDCILVASDAVDINQFDIEIEKDNERTKLNLPTDKKIILYTGHLYPWKGTDTLARSSEFLSSETTIIFIGGTPWDLASFKEKYSSMKNIMILGQKSHIEIPLYLKAADILVLPNSAKEDISRLYTSPMKLFEYMTSKVPIIASNLPSIREIVDESMVYFFPPDDPVSLANVIKEVLNDYQQALKKASKTFEVAKEYSWDKRAANILKFIKK